MRTALVILVALLFSSFCHAQKNATTDNKSLLWRISSKAMNKPSYLFGTIHVICPNDYFWTDSMEACLQRVNEACFEMDISNPQVMMQVAASMMDMSGKRLKDYFTPEQFLKLQKFVMDSLHIDISLFNQMKPVALESVFMNNAVNCSDPVMYEEKIQEKVKKAHKPITGLEEPEEEIALLDKIPTDSVIKEILSMLDGQASDTKEYDAMVNAYKKQDLPALYQLINNSKETDIDLGIFVNDRNRNWIDRMVDMMDQKSMFFAVGAGHLWGEKGVINLLRKKGYTVMPVK